MTKKLHLLVIYFLSEAVFAGSIPTRQHEKVQALVEARTFYIRNKTQYLAEVKFSEWEESQAFQSARLGLRRSLSRNFKMGLFYQRSYGLRHDNDWIKESAWHWLDRKTQGQDSFLTDFTYKNLINDRMTYEVRLTYEKNFTVGRGFIKPRIGISYFLTKSHFTLMEELSIPMETRSSAIQEYWTYFTYSYHYSNNVSFGPLLANRIVNWESSEDFKNRLNTTYQFKENIWYAGAQLVYHFGD